MSIRFKLLIQTLIPILCVTLLGIVSILWTTISQQRKLVNQSLVSNINQLESEIILKTTHLKKILTDCMSSNESGQRVDLN